MWGGTRCCHCSPSRALALARTWFVVRRRLRVPVPIDIGSGPPRVCHQSLFAFLAPPSRAKLCVMDVPPLADPRLCLVPDGVEFRLGFELEIGQRFLKVGHWRRIGRFSLPAARQREVAREALDRARASVRLCVRGEDVGQGGKLTPVRRGRQLHAFWTFPSGRWRRD